MKLAAATSLLTIGLTLSLNALANQVCIDDGKLNGDDYLTPVSKESDHKLMKSYTPADLIDVPAKYVWNTSGSTERLRKEVASSLMQMIDSAEKEQITLRIYSSFRSFNQQCGAYSSKFAKFKDYVNSQLKPGQDLNTELEKYVQNISAVPGRSEHQLGATFDLVYPSLGRKLVYPDSGNRCPKNSCKEYEWLLANAHKFGFAMSYPRLPGVKGDFNPVSQYSFEPWHWRYLGVEAATEIYDLIKELNRRISIIEYIKYKRGEITYSDLQNPLKSLRGPSSTSTGEIVIGMGGDVSLSRPGSDKLESHGSSFGKFYTWEQMTSGLKPMTENNDLNFMNLESVVSDKSLQTIEGKKYPQKSHPNGVNYLINNVGFNLISTANNHAYDYDQEGIDETLRNLIDIKSQTQKQIVISGLGTLNETLQPQVFELNGFRIAFIALGMKGDDRAHWESSWRPTSDKVGMLSVRNCANGQNEKAMKPCDEYGDLKQALENLKNTAADIRIISVHEGMELSVYTKNGSTPDVDSHLTADGKQRQRSENRNIEAKYNLIKSYGIDLIIGHHSHNARPVEYNNKTLAFYGLGNLLFLGGKNYSTNQFPLWNQFGLFAKTYYAYSQGKLQLAAVQIIPLKNNHISPTFWESTKANEFIAHMNAINTKSFGQNGVQFKSLNDGTGVFCVSNVDKGAKAALLCK